MKNLSLLLCTAPLIAAPPSPSVPAAEAVVAAFDRMASRPLWPNYVPSRIPLAIFDGTRTWLFRHPAAPAGFTPAGPGVWVFQGRWKDVVANTSTQLGGHTTATLMLHEGTPEAWATIAIHEGFHAFQVRHPSWKSNEMELFTYPVDDARVLALRRQEFEAFRRALQAKDAAEARGWAQAALAARETRFAAMPRGSVSYERGGELGEGLAVTVELRASGRKALDLMRPAEFPAEQIRKRLYAVGPAMAQLLDAFDSGWDGRLETNDQQYLDVMLKESLKGTPAATFTEAEVQRFQETAREEAGRIQADRKETLQAYRSRKGWSVVLEAAPDGPLQLEGFDPLNVRTLGAKELLHSRFLKLGNAQGTLEVMGGSALTEGAGAHPLFNGVRRVHLSGLTQKPVVETAEDGSLRLTASALKASLKGTTPRWEGQCLVIQFKP